METILDNLGVPYSGINLSYSNSGTYGTADGEILVQLKQERGRPTSEYIDQLRAKLPQQFPGTQFFFQPADIVTQILNFGTPAPIDVAISGNNVNGNYAVAQKLANEVRHIPGAVDVHVQQALDEPTLHMDIDRTRVQSVGLQARDAEFAGVAELELSDRASILARSAEWSELQRGGANAAVSRGLVPGFAKHSGDGLAGGSAAADYRQPGADFHHYKAGGGFALQCAADDQCVRVGERAGSGRRVGRLDEGSASDREGIAERQSHGGARSSTNDEDLI